MEFRHSPILTEEMASLLAWSQCGLLGDLTVGGGGHLRFLLERFPRPDRIIALDQDVEALKAARENLKKFEPIEWIHANFREAERLLPKSFDRLVVDLGVSSYQLDNPERGFSLRADGPLDMRMNPSAGVPAGEWLMRCDEEELAKVMREWGEEPRARLLARRWIERRRAIEGPLTTGKFVEALGSSLESKGFRGRHPLTKVFQAIRMHINDESGSLECLLRWIPQALNFSGRVGILTFHSLEDRQVKWALKGALTPINKKVIPPSRDETLRNPRSRSAKLRVYERTNEAFEDRDD